MYKHEKTIQGKIDINEVWDLYSNVNRWKEWDIFIDKVELNGAFENGTTGIIHMQQVGLIPFTLADIVENRKFTVKSNIGDIINLLEYEILTIGNSDMVILKDSVTLTGAPDENLKLIAEEAIVPVMMEILERKVSIAKINE